MRNLLFAGVAMVLAPLLHFQPVAGTGVAVQPPANEAVIVSGFQRGVQSYVELHRSLEGPVPTIAVSEDWQRVRAAIDALAIQIRAARKDARRGDIFTPDVERWFRRTIATLLRDCDIAELLASLNEENPEGLVLLPRVNGSWPEEASLGPMPPLLLGGLPPLPDELQYRFMNRDLVLWDAHANIIVDFITHVMP